MKFGVVVFPGSNCDMDMIHVIKNILHKEVVKLWHKNTDLQEVDCVILPGGFSYGDYLRSGAIAQFSPIMKEVIANSTSPASKMNPSTQNKKNFGNFMREFPNTQIRRSE